MTRTRDLASPNHDARPPGVPIDMLVLHYTGMQGADAALTRLCDAAAKVSAHYVVGEDGSVTRLVAEDRRAWHAGVGSWRGHRDVNARSIGIELVNPGHEFGYRAFTKAQMEALIALARDIVIRHRIPSRNVVGHSDVAPARKEDPGELFDWPLLARAGIGLWPVVGGGESVKLTIAELQAKLATYGYETPSSGVLDPPTISVLVAFQRHFRPARFDGQPDAETASRLDALLRQAD
jgi:N-acetylmuramoyl-L-alanine amidase